VGQPGVEHRRDRYGDHAGDDCEERGLRASRAQLLAAPEPHRHEEVALVLPDGPDQASREERGREGEGVAEQQDHQDGGRRARALGVEVRERARQLGRQSGEPGPVVDPGGQEAGCVVEAAPRVLQQGVVGERERGVRGDAERVDR
jgi:hypothetical protein